mgnify:CR=1 FL=1|tara:strand:+ start:363 stop:806 length:444 start_codon:yes stop_codon:yes gene_type:complete
MIISCEKCNKKFQISDELIPDSGRLLECGSCSYQWHFTPNRKLKLENDDENFEITEEEDLITEVKKEKKIQKKVINTKKNEIVKSEEKKVGFLSYLIVAIISLIALIIIVDTFQIFLKSFFPNIDIYLSSLYDSLTDIFLFLKDLIK